MFFIVCVLSFIPLKDAFPSKRTSVHVTIQNSG